MQAGTNNKSNIWANDQAMKTSVLRSAAAININGIAPTSHSVKLTARRLLERRVPHFEQIKCGLKNAASGLVPQRGQLVPAI
jgi:hypothetical protein